MAPSIRKQCTGATKHNAFQQHGKQKERQPGWTASQEKIDECVKKIYPVGLLSIPAGVPLCDAAADRSFCP